MAGRIPVRTAFTSDGGGGANSNLANQYGNEYVGQSHCCSRRGFIARCVVAEQRGMEKFL